MTYDFCFDCDRRIVRTGPGRVWRTVIDHSATCDERVGGHRPVGVAIRQERKAAST